MYQTIEWIHEVGGVFSERVIDEIKWSQLYEFKS